ncbi:MAG TPA: hypothetical protein VGC36_17670 [Rhizomicrobium sp.]
MRLASLLCLGLILAASAARAETWVHTRDGGGGMPMCFDKDSVKIGADNLTHYAVKMCQDAVPQWYAVDCVKNFKVELLVRIYDLRDPARYREMTVDDPDSGLAIDALMACNK